MKYTFIDQHVNEFSVVSMCRVLKVHRSGYYAWKSEPLGEYFYRENLPPEIPLQISLSDNKSSNGLPNSQPQQLIQPEIVLIPKPIKQIDSRPLSLSAHSESANFTQNPAVNLLNPSMQN